jgi:hypothetical protein
MELVKLLYEDRDLVSMMPQLIRYVFNFINLYRKKTLSQIKYTVLMSLAYTGKAVQQAPLCLKDRHMPLGINRLKNALELCCRNATKNHKFKLAVTGKAKSK